MIWIAIPYKNNKKSIIKKNLYNAVNAIELSTSRKHLDAINCWLIILMLNNKKDASKKNSNKKCAAVCWFLS